MVMQPGPGFGGLQAGMGTAQNPGLGPTQGEYLQPYDMENFLKALPPLPTKGRGRARKSNISLEEVQSRADSDVKFWESRQSRFREHQEDVELRKKTVPSTEESVTLSDPLSILLKMTGMLAKQDENIEFQARRPDLKQSAQAGENALRLIRKRMEQIWADGLHNPLKFDELQMLLLRGWIAARVCYDSDAAANWDGDPYSYFPWKIDLTDAANLFPNSPNKYTRVTHRYKCTVSELRDVSELDVSNIESMDDGDTVEVTGVYEFNNRWDYHCIFVSKGTNVQFIKDPTPIGYMPWVIGLAGGFFFRDTPWQDNADEYTKWMGVGILHALHQTQEYLNRYFSMLATMAGDTANPFTAIISDHPEDEAPQDGFVRGGTKRFRKDAAIQRVTRHDRGAEGLVIPLIKGLEERQEKSSLIRAMWGMGGDNASNSGFQTSFFIAVAHDIIFPYIRAWELFQQKLYEKVLEIFEDYAPLDIPLMVMAPPNGQTETHTWGEFWPEDVHNQGTMVEVTLDPMTVQDKLNLGQLTVALVDKNIISRETARGVEFLRIKDPKLEDNKILTELIKLDPKVIEFLVGTAAAQTGEDVLGQLFNMIHAPEMQQIIQQAQQPAQPPGMLPGQASPPAAQGQNQYQQMNQRGAPPSAPAAGGVGPGGMPPPPPMTNRPMP